MSTVFVSNLPYSLTNEKLAAEFGRFGKVTNARIMTRPFRGRRVSRGFGFVDFETADQMTQATNAQNITIDGRNCRIAVARPRVIVKDNVFIGNIAQEVDENRLKEYFAAYHPVQVKIVQKRQSDERKGFGYVQVQSEQDRDGAVQNLDGKDFCGLPLIVKVARKPFLPDEEIQRRAERRRARRSRRAPRAPQNAPAPQ